MVLIIVDKEHKEGDMALGTVEVKKSNYRIGDMVETKKGIFRITGIVHDDFHIVGYKVEH
jgi:hypothetical protein